MSTPDPQPRDIAVEQETEEIQRHLEEASEPEGQAEGGAGAGDRQP